MNREGKVQTALLDVLAEWTAPLDEVQLHVQVDQRLEAKGEPVTTSPAEFFDAVKQSENSGWIVKIENTRRGNLWLISNKGKGERLA